MDKDKLKKLGKEWTALDQEYDTYFQELLDQPEPQLLDDEKMSKLKKMQEKLFNLEIEIYKILRKE